MVTITILRCHLRSVPDLPHYRPSVRFDLFVLYDHLLPVAAYLPRAHRTHTAHAYYVYPTGVTTLQYHTLLLTDTLDTVLRIPRSFTFVVRCLLVFPLFRTVVTFVPGLPHTHLHRTSYHTLLLTFTTFVPHSLLLLVPVPIWCPTVTIACRPDVAYA